MTDYTRIIENIIPPDHNGNAGLGLADDVTANLILDVATRQIKPGENFSTLIGTTDDINTNIVTFCLENIEKADNHALLECNNIIVKWQHQKSLDKGTSPLTPKEEEGITYLQWLVPVEVLAAAGTVKISLCFYDTDNNGHVIYRWNSLPYSNLTIEQGMDEINTELVPLDEIITLDMRTRQVSVPSSLNREVGKHGETSLTTLRFRCDRYYQGYDFSDAAVQFYWRHQGEEVINASNMNNPDNGIRKIGDRLIEFDWSIPQAVLNKIGTFEFSVCLLLENGTVTIWYSNTCSDFRVGETMIGDVWTPGESEGDAELYIVNGEVLAQTIDNMLSSDEELAATGSMTVSDAIAYSIAKFMESGTTINSGDAQEYIEE